MELLWCIFFFPTKSSDIYSFAYSSLALPMKSFRMSFLRKFSWVSQHANSNMNLCVNRLSRTGSLQGNNSPVTEESSCKKYAILWTFHVWCMFGCVPQQHICDRAMKLPLLSMTLVCLKPRDWCTYSRHLGYTKLPRYLQIATSLLLAWLAWSYSEIL